MDQLSYFVISFEVIYKDGKVFCSSTILEIEGYLNLNKKDKATILSEEIAMYGKINFNEHRFLVTDVFEIQ